MENNFLENIKLPSDIKEMDNIQLEKLCGEIRSYLIETISKTGGHLASNLGTVELTVALHKAFDMPNDKIVFDVGHQCYTHKILTGRKDKFSSLRQKGGISGFPKPDESEYDSFISGHSSTSISAALGIAQGLKLNDTENFAIAVIGDGALTGGEAYEALNNGGRSNTRLIIILNHNDMSISKNVGAFARYLSTIRSRPTYFHFKSKVANVLNKIPIFGKHIINWIETSKSMLKTLIYKATFFEELGYKYLGPIDGHNIKEMESIFKLAKEFNSPVLIQVETKKGKGYPFAEENPGAYHAIGGFDILNGGDDVSMSDCYSNAIGAKLSELAFDNKKICAITAAMKYGTGLHIFYQNHRERFFDVGIAEQHAVTFAGGIASQGLIPIFCVYSSFLQRGYDQILHDLSIDKKHVVLCVDRAGIVGEDGETHQGIFDVSFLSHIPNIKIYSPEGYEEAQLCLEKAINQDEGVVCVRYPRGADKKDHNMEMSTEYSYLEQNSNTLIISYGRITTNCFKAMQSLKEKGRLVSLLKLTDITTLDKPMQIAFKYDKVLFVEESIKIGSISEQFSSKMLEEGYKGKLIIKAIDNKFVKQGNVNEILQDLGMDSASIEKIIQQEM